MNVDNNSHDKIGILNRAIDGEAENQPPLVLMIKKPKTFFINSHIKAKRFRSINSVNE